MAKEYAKKFYKGKEWKKTRRSYIDKRVMIDGGMCEACKKELGYIVDHIEEITPETIYDTNITLNHGNLQYLCLSCHNTKTFSASPYKFSDDGELIPLARKKYVRDLNTF